MECSRKEHHDPLLAGAGRRDRRQRRLPHRADGTTPGTLTWIWSVVVDGRVFVRAWNGQRGRWYRSAIEQGAGVITAAGKRYEVAFTPVDDEQLNDRIDEAYRTKYASSSYMPPMVAAGPRSATVEVTPR